MKDQEPGKPIGGHPTGDMLNAQLLAMLKGWSAYGYELAQQLNDAGFGNYNKGSIYRALRNMEATGLVSSTRDTTSSGPAKRVYSVTRAGTAFLDNWFSLLSWHSKMLNNFLNAGLSATRERSEKKRAE